MSAGVVTRAIRASVVGSVTPAAYDYSSEGGLVLCLFSDLGIYQDSALTTPVTADSDLVGGMVGQFGTTINATQSGTARPVYKTSILNGLPVIRSNGVDAWLDCGKPAALDLHADMTAFAVWAPRTVTQAAKYVYGNYDSGGNRTQFARILLKPAASEFAAWEQVATDLTIFRAQGTAALVANAFHVSEGVRDDTAKTVDIYLDGADNITGSYTGKTIASYAQAGNLALFRAGSFAGAYGNADLACLLIYNNKLSSAARARVRAALGTKYAITVV